MKSDEFCEITDDGEPIPLTGKKLLRKLAKEKKRMKDNALASVVAEKFLAENVNINFETFVEHIKINIISSIDCAERLGISPKAFARLKKKYDIEPIYTARNKPDSLKQMSHIKNKYATKNFFSTTQLSKIPQAEIDLVQIRSARSLSFPRGLNEPLPWKRRGRHWNGKLKARTNMLSKFGIHTSYNEHTNKYGVRIKGVESILTKKEVDSLNTKYSKMKVFV